MLVQGDEVSTILRLDDLILGRYYLMRFLLVQIRSRIHPVFDASLYLSFWRGCSSEYSIHTRALDSV